MDQNEMIIMFTGMALSGAAANPNVKPEHVAAHAREIAQATVFQLQAIGVIQPAQAPAQQPVFATVPKTVNGVSNQ